MRKMLLFAFAAAVIVAMGSGAYLRANGPTGPTVVDESGAELHVGDVVATLTPAADGGCSGDSAIIGKGQEGDGGGFVEASLAPDCRLVITKIERAADHRPEKQGGSASEPLQTK